MTAPAPKRPVIAAIRYAGTTAGLLRGCGTASADPGLPMPGTAWRTRAAPHVCASAPDGDRRAWSTRRRQPHAELSLWVVARPPVWLLQLCRRNVLLDGECPVTAAGPGAGTAAAGAARLCGLG